jgi:hypothetical protein
MNHIQKFNQFDKTYENSESIESINLSSLKKRAEEIYNSPEFKKFIQELPTNKLSKIKSQFFNSLEKFGSIENMFAKTKEKAKQEYSKQNESLLGTIGSVLLFVVGLGSVAAILNFVFNYNSQQAGGIRGELVGWAAVTAILSAIGVTFILLMFLFGVTF